MENEFSPQRAQNLIAHWNERALQPYKDRTFSGFSQLDDMHFEFWNDGSDAGACATCGCLDALDAIPSGAHRSGHDDGWGPGAYYPHFHAERDWLTPAQMKEREELAEKLIAEILAEESK